MIEQVFSQVFYKLNSELWGLFVLKKIIKLGMIKITYKGGYIV